MSLGIAFKVPEGIVLAADSRISLFNSYGPLADGGPIVQIPSYFDHSTKLLELRQYRRVAMVTYGLGVLATDLGPRTAHSYLPEFEATLSQGPGTGGSEPQSLSVRDIANKWSEFLRSQYEAANTPYIDDMYFIVGGYDIEDAYGKLYTLSIPSNPEPVEAMEGNFGPVWGGDTAIVQRIVNGFDMSLVFLLQNEFELSDDDVLELITRWKQQTGLKIPTVFLSLQDAINMCTGLIRATVSAQSWTTGERTVGGDTDVAVITRTDDFRFVQRKEIRGELK